MEKRGQAALEFLTTYGWAFLVILIMIGALAYFGILKPSKLLPDRCNFGTEIECQDYMITGGATGTVDLRLKNNIGQTIAVTAWNIKTETNTQPACTSASTPASWGAGNVSDFQFSNCNFNNAGLVAGDKGKVLLSLTYNTVKSGAAYKHDVQGEVYANVK